MSGARPAGVHVVRGYALGRLPNEFEYVTPRGGSLTVPMWAITPAIDAGVRFGGKARYGLQECRYVRTIGRQVDEATYTNLITNEGLEGIANMLIDASATYDTGIKRAEIGDGDGAAVTPTIDATALVDAASVRYATNAPSQSGGVITVVTAATVAGGSNIYIREFGVFAHDNTATRAAGHLLQYMSVDIDNTGGGAVDKTFTSTLDLTRLQDD